MKTTHLERYIFNDMPVKMLTNVNPPEWVVFREYLFQEMAGASTSGAHNLFRRFEGKIYLDVVINIIIPYPMFCFYNICKNLTNMFNRKK